MNNLERLEDEIEQESSSLKEPELLHEFTVIGKIHGKQRARFTTKNNHIHSYTPSPTIDYERQIKQAFYKINEGFVSYISDCPIRIEIEALIKIPNSWSISKTQQARMGRIKPVGTPDTDNILKIVKDALNKVAYNDDKQVIEDEIVKRYCKTEEQEQLRIRIYEYD